MTTRIENLKIARTKMDLVRDITIASKEEIESIRDYIVKMSQMSHEEAQDFRQTKAGESILEKMVEVQKPLNDAVNDLTVFLLDNFKDDEEVCAGIMKNVSGDFSNEYTEEEREVGKDVHDYYYLEKEFNVEELSNQRDAVVITSAMKTITSIYRSPISISGVPAFGRFTNIYGPVIFIYI